MKLKTRLGYWLGSWVLLIGAIVEILTFGLCDAIDWHERLMDWLDKHGFEILYSSEEFKKELEEK